MARNLKDRQIEAIKCMLNFNTPVTPGEVPQWKVLIYDKAGRDVITLLLSVKELRSFGVTLHLLIDSPREHITDVPAVYFVYPTEENIRIICKDFECGNYESYYLNFISPISRIHLETLAKTALSQECAQQITKVFDQFTNFVCLEDDLFILRPSIIDTPSYYALNRANTTDADIEAVIETAAEGLFSVFATLGTVPIIRCPGRDASEKIATCLDRRFRDCLHDTRKTLFLGPDSTARGFQGDQGLSSGASGPNANTLRPNLFQRPLLILLDRNLDPATPLHHDLTYQSLVHDLFTIRLNRIEVDSSILSSADNTTANGSSKSSESSTNRKRGKVEQYDLFANTDYIWRDVKDTHFVHASDAIVDEVKGLQDHEMRRNELKSTMGLGSNVPQLAESSVNVSEGSTTYLKNTINSLPQLLERRRCIEVHIALATCVSNLLKKRKLAEFIDKERELLSRQAKSDVQESEICAVIRQQDLGSPEDKLRLVLLAALLREDHSILPTGSSNHGAAGSGADFQFSSEQLGRMVSALAEAYPEMDTSSINYVRKQLRFCLNANENSASRGNTHQNVFDKIVSRGSAIFQTSMESLMNRKTYLPFTKIVSQLMENKVGSEVVENYVYLDPQTQRRYNQLVPRTTQPFYEAYVFVVGGGSYVEYQNLLDWSRSTSSSALPQSRSSSALQPSSGRGGANGGIGLTRCVTYGCTELVSPREYLQQLTKLGHGV